MTKLLECLTCREAGVDPFPLEREIDFSERYTDPGEREREEQKIAELVAGNHIDDEIKREARDRATDLLVKRGDFTSKKEVFDAFLDSGGEYIPGSVDIRPTIPPHRVTVNATPYLPEYLKEEVSVP